MPSTCTDISNATSLQDAIAAITKRLTDGEFANSRNFTNALTTTFGLTQTNAEQAIRTLCDSITEKLFPPVEKLELFLSYRCPLRCDYCFVSEKDSGRRMTDATARKAVDFLLAASRNKSIVEILFFGGEPLMEFASIRKIVSYARARAEGLNKTVAFSMTVNGVLFTRDILEFCRAEGIKFLLSIDGDRETHDRHRKTADGKGSFDILAALLPEMKQYQHWMGARMTVHPDTADRLSANVRFLIDKGINQFIICPVEGTRWAEHRIDCYQRELVSLHDFYREQKTLGASIRMNLFDEMRQQDFFAKESRWGCRAGRHSLAVAPDGTIYPCSKMIGTEKLRFETRLGDLDQGITNLALRLRLNDRIAVGRPKCGSCHNNSFCTGGCIAVNFQETGDLFSPASGECAFTAMTRTLAEHVRSFTDGPDRPGEDMVPE